MANPLIESRLRLLFRDRQKLLTGGLLLAILALGAFLHFYQLGATGVGNEYYAAAVKSMLLSWKNFFFVAFEPGGSVSVDKPPLGLWVEAVSAYFLGVNGFALALPNALAGVLSIFVLYKLIRRPFGTWIGLLAALALAVTPVAIATERNNTIDGLLAFVLLLAAWACLQAVYSGRLRWLLLGAFIVGLGFNIKMLQAFLPLPAFYALYFFGARHGWWKKILHLGAATAVLLAVSLSWAIIVDLTPASARPYVDSSSNNSVMELIIGHNGLERLIGGGGGRQPGDSGQPSQPPDGNFDGQRPQPPAGQNAQGGQLAQGQPPQAFAGQGFPPGQGGSTQKQLGGPDGQNSPNGGNQPGQPGGSRDFGSAGTLRLFTAPLAGEASWLLPFALGGILLLAALGWKKPLNEQTLALILWAGWLLPEAIYFSYSAGLMHAYYLLMLGAPLAALVGMTAWGLWKLITPRPLLGWGAAALLGALTLAFQAVTLWSYPSFAIPALVLAGLLFGSGLALAAASRLGARFVPAALTLILAALLVAPFTWSVLTAFNEAPNAALPYAGPAQSDQPGDELGNKNASNTSLTAPREAQSGVDQDLLAYLLENTAPGTYLLATDRANSAAPYILATGRPVLAIGGFLNQAEEVSAEQVAALVESGQLRFVLGDALDGHQAIGQWVEQHCSAVDSASITGAASPTNGPGGHANNILYDCGD